jgi:hypothetical protein
LSFATVLLNVTLCRRFGQAYLEHLQSQGRRLLHPENEGFAISKTPEAASKSSRLRVQKDGLLKRKRQTKTGQKAGPWSNVL